MKACKGVGKAKTVEVEEIIGKLGWWIDRQPKAKSHLNGRGGVLHATLRRDHLAFPGEPSGYPPIHSLLPSHALSLRNNTSNFNCDIEVRL